MELEKQVCSSELAKKLKKLGIKQESLWVWIKWCYTKPTHPKHPLYTTEIQLNSGVNYPYKEYIKEEFSAFTVAELGEMLPISITKKHHEINFCRGSICEYPKKPVFDWHVRYLEAYSDKIIHNVWDVSEANARAKMLCWLIEQKKITKRL